jgi:hypothetical protein
MTPVTSAPYTPSETNASFMMLPTHVDGFIDLKTLADIHRFLGQSASEDDLVLAAWVKDNYLYEPINVDGREIRTTEGFSKLDRAYRRVRSLTNKAQDKWPFFDRAWKTMSSNTVKNNARGEASPGVSLLGMNNATPDASISNAQDARCSESLRVKIQVESNLLSCTDTSSTASSFVSFGPDRPARRMMHRKQSFQNPMPNTPVPLPPTKQGTLGLKLESEQQADAASDFETEIQSRSGHTSQASPEHTGMFTSTISIAHTEFFE